MEPPISTTLNEVDILIQWIGKNKPFDVPQPPLTAIERKWAIHLSELQNDDLIAPLSPGTWSLAYADVYQFTVEQLNILDLPVPEPLTASVYSTKTESGRGRMFGLDLRNDEYGVLNRNRRRGPFIEIAPGNFILPEPGIFQLEQAISAGPDTEHYESENAAQQAYQAKVKSLAEQVGAKVEPWLEREQYEFPSSIGVTLVGDLENGLQVQPHPTGTEDSRLQELLTRSRGENGVIWRGEGRNRRRLILEPNQREVLRELDRRGGKIQPEDIPEFLDTPEAFLPPGIDLSDFSERVKGLKIRVYDSRPYLHVRQDKLEWFPKLEINLDPRLDTGQVPGVETPQSPLISDDDYLNKARKAMEAGRSSFIHSGSIIHFDPNAITPIAKLDEIVGHDGIRGLSGTKKYILDIFENIESLEYSLDIDEEISHDVDEQREILEFPIPVALQATLRPFQETGFKWLCTLDRRKRGGLLADDMGLGKTLQVISFLAARKEDDQVSPSLVVLPKTLIQNWFEEIQRFCPSLRVAQFRSGTVSDSAIFQNFDLVLITYDALRTNQVDLARIDWNVVVCDEAQAIKNPTTGRSTAVKGLKSQMRIAMTGTPVENGLSELWSIMDWVQPGLLRSRLDFRTEFERPIVDADDESSRNRNVRALQERILNHYLRRMKSEVLAGLPPKNIHRLETALSSRQVKQYHDAVSRARNGGRGAMLGCLQELLLLCACPWTENEAYGVQGTPDDLKQCPKLGALLDKLDEIRDLREKALIFVNRYDVQGMLQSVILNRYGLRTDLINGKVTGGRQDIVNRFNDQHGFQILLLSQEVGGTGLNITSANHVFHYMRPWNPAKENQATDRVHRIGQEKPVHVYLPIATWPDGSSESVEEVLDRLIEQKMALATDVIVPTAKMPLDQEVMRVVFSNEPN
ncbi:DEAD/DEAH box helicase [bacterium]|nr:DEAD/DEAH box helicase [bacterium]